MTARKAGEDWTPEAVRKLWDWYGANPYVQGQYFTAMVGPGVVAFLAATGKLSGKVLDYGCGPGHMLSVLLDRGLACHGADSSPESIRVVNERFAGRRNWAGGVVVEGGAIPFPDGCFDAVFCVETFEHLPEGAARALVAELTRVMKPGGVGIVTTPFAERLEQNFVYCPFCEAEFHKWQHLRSFTAAELEALVAGGGLDVPFCGSMDFEAFQRPDALPRLRELNAARLSSWLAAAGRRLLDRLSPRPFPEGRDFRHRLGSGSGRHLCAVVSRRLP